MRRRLDFHRQEMHISLPRFARMENGGHSVAPPFSARPNVRLLSMVPHRTRIGFTLIELMVVMVVISVLASLMLVAGMAFVGRAREARTRTTISKIDEAIQERITAINRYHERPASRLERDWEQKGWLGFWKANGLDSYAATQATQSGGPDEARKVLSRKFMMMETFPQTREELKLCYWFWSRFKNSAVTQAVRNNLIISGQYPPLIPSEIAEMEAFLNDMDRDSSTMPPQSLDRPGEILYFALTNAPVFGGLPMVPEDFEEHELFAEVKPSAGPNLDPNSDDFDGVPELKDAWDQPLRFYRWPTRLVNGGEFAFKADGTINPTGDWHNNASLISLMPGSPNADLVQDPDDRAGYLSVGNPLLGSTAQQVPVVVYFHDIDTWHAPLVVSAGPDGELGIDEPSVSIPLPKSGGKIHRLGMARPLSSPPVAGELPPENLADPTWTLPVADPSFNEFLYDNLTNFTIDGGS